MHPICQVRGMNGAARKDELFLFVLLNYVNQVPGCALPYEKFPFPNDDIFLEILRSCFTDAEVFHFCRKFDLHFFQYTEVVVDRIFTGKNDRCKRKRTYILLSEFIGGYSFNLDELPKVHFQIPLFLQVMVRRTFITWQGLGDQD